MRIVIDMQGAQTESRFRGIGRYTLALTQAIVRNRGEHEVIVALSGLFPDTIEDIRAAFHGLLPQSHLRVWCAPGPVRQLNEANQQRWLVAERIREAFMQSLQPDVIHIPSLFEGYGDDAVLSIGGLEVATPTTVTLHDLIPLIYSDHYLVNNPKFEGYYRRRLEQLKRASQFLAISESSRQEIVDLLGVDPGRVHNTSEAVGDQFQVTEIPQVQADELLSRIGITQPFVLYTGGSDSRKNLPRLIQAFARLPAAVRNYHQLLLAGKMPHGDIKVLRDVAVQAGLASDEVIFPGYVTDTELVQLYNLCKLYVFASWHEGFGLPVLEAMRCGAAVIGANTSSLPEVIGQPEALFNPLDVNAIASKMEQGLVDESFRTRLQEHGLQQARKFSWDESARRAIAVWEALYDEQQAKQKLAAGPCGREALLPALATQVKKARKNRILHDLAACIALNEQAGITRQLFVDISELHNNDAGTGVQRVVRSYLHALLDAPPNGFDVVPVYATRNHGYCHARQYLNKLGYAQGDAADTPIHWQRGDVFFALDMQHHVQLHHAAFLQQLKASGVTVKFLVHDLLPIQLADLFKDDDAKALHEQWLSMIAQTDGALCVSQATADALDAWMQSAGINRSPGFQLTWVHNGADISHAMHSRGLPDDAQAVLSAIASRPSFLVVSTLEPRKGQQQVFEAVQSLWQQGEDVNLVLVGRQGWKVDDLARVLREHPENGKRLFWLEGISDDYLQAVYRASSAVIAASINEGFGLSLIEAASYQLPIIARDIPVFKEVAGQHACYFKDESAQGLARTLQDWLAQYAKGQHPKSDGLSWNTWQQSAEQLKTALLQHYPRQQLLVDISELVQRDAKSGIQRVVRAVLGEWLKAPPHGYRVEPVYATVDGGYRYARKFIHGFTGQTGQPAADELIDYAPGDVFFGLDMQPQVVYAQRAFYQQLRRQGVRVKFLLHDLLSIQMPQYFPEGNEAGFVRWLKVITASDGVICVSQTVANELAEWLKENGEPRSRPLQIDWSHNGADIDNSAPSTGMPDDAQSVLAQLQARPSFLMVGTLEPRKGHAQVLEAFTQLWQQGKDVNLVIVGKTGWKCEALVQSIQQHSQYNKRLYWLAGISDEYLEAVYAASTCLIAASYGEGFGLPLIEAAQHGLPIIARDIPVFREVAGNEAFYFEADNSNELSVAISTILDAPLFAEIPGTGCIKAISWKESAQRCLLHVTSR